MRDLTLKDLAALEAELAQVRAAMYEAEAEAGSRRVVMRKVEDRVRLLKMNLVSRAVTLPG